MIRTTLDVCRYIPFAGIIPGGLILLDELARDRQHSIHILAKIYLYDRKPEHPIRDGLLYMTPFVNTAFGLCKLIVAIARRIFDLLSRKQEPLVPATTSAAPRSAPLVPSLPSTAAVQPTPAVELVPPLPEPTAPESLSLEQLLLYQEEAPSEKDAKKALAVAYCHLDLGDQESALDWLCKADGYGNGQLNIDLTSFFSKITAIHHAELFAHERLSLAAAASPTILTVDLTHADWNNEIARHVAVFLDNTQSVTHVHLKNEMTSVPKPLSKLDFPPIAAAFQINTSIQELAIKESLDDSVILQLLTAVENNPQSVLKTLFFHCSGLGDLSANKLITLLESGKITQFTVVVPSTDSGVSNTLVGRRSATEVSLVGDDFHYMYKI